MRPVSLGLTARTIVSVLCLGALLCGHGFGQAQPNQPDTSKPQGPKVVFEFEWAEADPHWYQISVDAQGNTEYQSQPKVESSETPGDPFVQRFTLTPKTRERIFALASATNYFKGAFDYKGSTRMAQTGAKTLRYESGGTVNAATFNYSENKSIAELAAIFQGISTTVELGHQLSQARRFDKLGVDAILRRIEELYKTRDVIELQTIAPVLQQISSDHQSMNMARQRADHLLAAATQ